MRPGYIESKFEHSSHPAKNMGLIKNGLALLAVTAAMAGCGQSQKSEKPNSDTRQKTSKKTDAKSSIEPKSKISDEGTIRESIPAKSVPNNASAIEVAVGFQQAAVDGDHSAGCELSNVPKECFEVDSKFHAEPNPSVAPVGQAMEVGPSPRGSCNPHEASLVPSDETSTYVYFEVVGGFSVCHPLIKTANGWRLFIPKP